MGIPVDIHGCGGRILAKLGVFYFDVSIARLK